jgi:hypothetical protein
VVTRKKTEKRDDKKIIMHFTGIPRIFLRIIMKFLSRKIKRKKIQKFGKLF